MLEELYIEELNIENIKNILLSIKNLKVFESSMKLYIFNNVYKFFVYIYKIYRFCDE